MQTVLTMAERLDMSAEEAVEKLKYMFFDVKGIGSDISDEQCDLLIDIDDDPALADEIRAKKLAEIEKVKAAAAKKKAAAEKKKAAGEKKKAAVKKKVVAKKKTAVKKAPAKKKAVKKKAPKKKAATEVGDGEAVEKVLAKKPVKKGPIAEILPSDEEMAAQKAGADDALKIVVGSASEHETGQREAEDLPDDVAAVSEDCDAHEQVTTKVQAGHGCILVDERRRLQDTVRFGSFGHGINESPGVHEPRRRDGQQYEDDQPDGTGDEEGVTVDGVLFPVEHEEPDRHEDDHRPVSPDIGPIR